MKKETVGILIVVVIALFLMGCGGTGSAASDKSNVQPDSTASSQADATASKNNAESGTESQKDGALISEDDVKEIALKDAGQTEDKITGIQIKLETDDGIQKYEIEFYADNNEYDYEIDAVSGSILSKNMESGDDFSKLGSSDAAISEEEAKTIALNKVSGAGEGDISIHLNNDDGKAVYEGSIVYNEIKYEFEIDAGSGDILEWEEESVYD